MNYQQVLTYLDSLQPKTFRLELGPLSEACHILRRPQDAFQTVHISGTNGKGSTAAFLERILRSSGYRVGLLTSPHLIDVRERIRINGEMLDRDRFVEVITQLRDELPDERMLSYFEIITLASFIVFRDQGVDVAVIETGLGGRLDATNVVSPKVAVITPISEDHTHHLGRTLTEIAREKSGIIKRGVPTVVAYQPPDVMEVIRRTCNDVGSPLCLATPDEIASPLGLAGEHQRQNAACAVEAAHLLGQSGMHIEGIEAALAATQWPGRLETVQLKPHVILDAAHNVAGAESLATYVRKEFQREKAVLLLGVLADKDVAGIIRPLAPLFREVVCVEAPSNRTASPKDLAAAARSSGTKITIAKDVLTALAETIATLAEDDALVVSGSLTVVGAAKEYFDGVKETGPHD